MPRLLVTGPGGAGSSTVAAAAAVRAARAGRRAVLLTQQHPVVPDLDGVPGLEVVLVDAGSAVERAWSGSAGVLAALLPHLSPPPASSVVPVPGVAELALLAELGRAEARADLVVVDAGPLAAATALVALPASLRWWLGQLAPDRLRTPAAVGTATGLPGAAALVLVPALERLLAGAPPAAPPGTPAWLVAPARAAAVGAVRSAATQLAVHGVRTAAVLARVLPVAGGSAWWAQRGAEQDAALAALGEVAGAAGVRRVPERATAPADAAALAALLDVDPPDDRADDHPAGAAVPAGPQRVPGGWRLLVPLPFAERDAVELTRWADDLVVTAGGARRSLRLDPLLRRCTATGGRLLDPGTAGARLEVCFVPDPQQWPAGLLAAQERAG